jgi:hypothetical protein
VCEVDDDKGEELKIRFYAVNEREHPKQDPLGLVGIHPFVGSLSANYQPSVRSDIVSNCNTNIILAQRFALHDVTDFEGKLVL